MKRVNILHALDKAGALLEGHFLLSSGLHSSRYLQSALLLRYPAYAKKFCSRLAIKFKNKKIDVVVGPAYGGIIVAYELACALGVKALFAERKDGIMQLRRNFSIERGERVLVAEDVVTTGRSVKDVVNAIEPFKPRIVGIAALIDRSGKKAPFGKIPFASLAKVNIRTYKPRQCPLCKEGIPLSRPGSRR